MISVAVTFHGPFRISQGTGSGGIDDTVVRGRIPASSLKGVTRAAARLRLGLPPAVIERIFGTNRSPSPWAWTDLELTGEHVVTARTRIAIDPATGAAARDAFLLAEETWVRAPQTYAIDRVDPDDGSTHTDALLLAASCRAVHSLGASRRRGLGWVSMIPSLAGNEVDAAAAARAVITARQEEQ